MNCSFCGAELENGSSFCGVCGNSTYSVGYTPVAVVEKKKNPGFVFGLISLICGIVAVLSVLAGLPYCCCVYVAVPVMIGGGILGTILAIVSIVLAIIGLKKSKAGGFKNAMAIVGIILSVLAMVFIVIEIVGCVLLLALGLGTYLTEMAYIMSAF